MSVLDKWKELIGQELKIALRHPRSLGTYIEGRSEWLNRHFLGAASNIVEPFVAGMGLQVEALEEERIEVSLPGHWRNQGEGGLIHVGAVATLGEFTTRLFWEHHMDLRQSEMRATRVETRLLTAPSGPLRAVFRMNEGEREELFRQLRETGEAHAEAPVAIFDENERLVSEVEVSWHLFRQLSLGGARNNK